MNGELRDAITDMLAAASSASTNIGAVHSGYSVEQLTAFVSECWDIASALDRSAAKLQRLIDRSDWEDYLASHPAEAAVHSKAVQA